MTSPTRHGRRRYAHRASSRRREPVFAITAGVLLVALCIPVAWRALSNRSDRRVAARRAAPSNPSSVPRPLAAPPTTSLGTVSRTTGPPTTPIPPTAPGVLIHVVPALRDIQFRVGQTLYTTSSDGMVDVPDARGNVKVSYVGYSVTPPLQQINLRSWSDGSTAPDRVLDASGHGHVSVAVDLRYRVTIKITGLDNSTSRTLKLTSPVGSLTVTDGSQHWVLATRGERSSVGIVARTTTYSFGPPRGAPTGRSQEFTATPESLWVIRAA